MSRTYRNNPAARIAGGAITASALLLFAAACRDSGIKPSDVASTPPQQPVVVQPAVEVVQPETGSVIPANVSYADAESTFRTKDYQQAAEMFDVYTKSHEKNAWGYYMLGLSAWKAGDPAQAESAFVAALDMDPRHVKSMLNLSRVLLDTDRPTDALSRVQAALEIDSASTDAYRLLGRTQFALGNVDDAIDAYRKAITLDENDVWSMNNLGLIFIQQGRYQDALSPLARATQLDSTVAAFQNNLGIALERTGHVVASAAAYRAALAADSSYEKASVSLARVDGRTDDPGVEPVDLATLAQDFAMEIEQWRGTAAPAVAESLVTVPKVGMDSVSKPE